MVRPYPLHCFLSFCPTRQSSSAFVMKMVDMKGQVHGHLTVLELSHTRKGVAHWKVRCACGTEKTVAGKHMRQGRVISCGCQRGPEVKYPDRLARIRELFAANPEKYRAYHRRHKQKNPERVKAQGRIHSSLVRARRALLKPVVPWSERDLIREVYLQAKRRNWEVDHIVPISSKFVCGLHVWSNLQVLERHENRSKGNRFWPDMPDYTARPNSLQALTA